MAGRSPKLWWERSGGQGEMGPELSNTFSPHQRPRHHHGRPGDLRLLVSAPSGVVAARAAPGGARCGPPNLPLPSVHVFAPFPIASRAHPRLLPPPRFVAQGGHQPADVADHQHLLLQQGDLPPRAHLQRERRECGAPTRVPPARPGPARPFCGPGAAPARPPFASLASLMSQAALAAAGVRPGSAPRAHKGVEGPPPHSAPSPLSWTLPPSHPPLPPSLSHRRPSTRSATRASRTLRASRPSRS